MKTGLEAQILLRLPEKLAEKVHEKLQTKENEAAAIMRMEFVADSREFVPSPENSRHRIVVLTYGDRKHIGALVDLPTHIESLKTFDQEIYYKIGDLSQMLVIYNEEDKVEDGLPCDTNITAVSPSGSFNQYYYESGITPPTWGIRTRYFRESVVCNCEGSSPNCDAYVCAKCGLIPKSQVLLAEEILRRNSKNSVVSYVIEEEEYETEVTDSDTSDSDSDSDLDSEKSIPVPLAPTASTFETPPVSEHSLPKIFRPSGFVGSLPHPTRRRLPKKMGFAPPNRQTDRRRAVKTTDQNAANTVSAGKKALVSRRTHLGREIKTLEEKIVETENKVTVAKNNCWKLIFEKKVRCLKAKRSALVKL